MSDDTRIRCARREGPAKWQNTTPVVEMRAAAESAVITAVVGLEAFSNHHVTRVADPQTGELHVAGKRSLAERYYLGEYQGATRMVRGLRALPSNWVSDDRLRAIGDGRARSRTRSQHWPRRGGD